MKKRCILYVVVGIIVLIVGVLVFLVIRNSNHSSTNDNGSQPTVTTDNNDEGNYPTPTGNNNGEGGQSTPQGTPTDDPNVTIRPPRPEYEQVRVGSVDELLEWIDTVDAETFQSGRYKNVVTMLSTTI